MTDPPVRAGGRFGEWPWRIVTVSLVALFAVAVVATAISLAVTLSMGQLSERLLRTDVSLEDEAEDVHVAVLALRHEHRNLALIGPTRAGREDHATALEALREELDELEAIEDVPLDAFDPVDFREAVDDYASELRSVIPLHATDPAAYGEAFDLGLARIAEWEQETSALDASATTRASDAIRRLGESTSIATLVMLAVLVAVVVAGLVLTILAIRVLWELRRLAAVERGSAARISDLLQTRSDFIADASHELRTPLTVVRGTAEVAIKTGPPDCVHVPALREITDETARMGRLVEELLFVARHDAGGSQLERVDTALEALMADIATRAEALTRQTEGELEVDGEVTGLAHLDGEQVSRAVLVLIDNAVRYGPPGGTVRMEAAVEGQTLRIAVLDRGPGIPDDVLPFIFERFRRGSRTNGGPGGVGLGLAIARAVVEAHGGTITAVARDGGGTCMIIRLSLDGDPLATSVRNGPWAP